ncbi:uncharacterized protein LOC107035932 isoform X1 [Diachasma alloeum]|uniref:uncharacterized protein LOC107035932 isoform X1 n=1 Tax=Diachasma alloeum TaxID=454923 RepID=UPI0007381126|nr:uncharacterized protein LOC107035932 isoform X1 [Diachasma alloeum]XP_015109070.1 uncharacterized protein LOC107035932 isoform X1 [Diachasma alloeum]
MESELNFEAHLSDDEDDDEKVVVEKYSTEKPTGNKDISATGKYKWSNAATKSFLDLYTEEMQKLSSKLTKTTKVQNKLWEAISSGMNLQGYHVDVPKCRSKWQTMQRKYKVVHDHNIHSGADRMDWMFFENMQLGKTPYMAPLSTASSAGEAGEQSLEYQTDAQRDKKDN